MLGLITVEEEVLIEQIRKRFKEELHRREAAGTAPASFFGQFALVRALRGNEGNLAETEKWFEAFLKKADESGLAELAAEMAQKLESSDTGWPSDTMLPYANEVAGYIRAVFTAPKPTPEGGPVNYIPLVRFNKRAIYNSLEWSHFVRYMHGATVLRVIECDRLSIAKNKPVQVVTIFDLSGCSLADLVCPKFDLAYTRDVSPFQMQVAAEIFGPTYLLNTPKFVLDLYWALFRLIPDKFRSKLHLMQKDGLDDPDFIHLVGGKDQLQWMLSMRNMEAEPEEAQEPSFQQNIGRRGSFVHSVDVMPGQRLDWSFEVLHGTFDNLLGDSDVGFSARAVWTAEGEAAAAGAAHHHQLVVLLGRMQPEVLVPHQRVAASNGQVRGSHVVKRPGVITLHWSNRHSLARSKALRCCVHVASVPKDTIKPRTPQRKPAHSASEARDSQLMRCCVARPAES